MATQGSCQWVELGKKRNPPEFDSIPDAVAPTLVGVAARRSRASFFCGCTPVRRGSISPAVAPTGFPMSQMPLFRALSVAIRADPAPDAELLRRFVEANDRNVF